MFWKEVRSADVQLQLYTSAAPPEQKPRPLSDSPGKYFLLHSVVLVSASPYFKARCWSDGAEGQLQYTDGAPTVRAPAVGQVEILSCGPLLLVEHVEEEELQAMEAVLRHCYTDELCDVGGEASELSVTLLVQILVLSNR